MENKFRESYIPEGTCAKNFVFDLHKDSKGNYIFDELRVFGSKCAGNTQILNKLAKGKKIKDLIPEFENIVCSCYNSCYSELSKAFKEFLDKQKGANPLDITHKRKQPLTREREA